jgi:hypothetical protein
MQRTTIIPEINPTDNSPIGVPRLTFGTQAAKPAFPTGGLFSSGSLRFDLNNITMVELAKEAFLNNSLHKDSESALKTFLLCLSITSHFEGGFDSVNTYDIAGISIGFLQFARPEGGAGRLLELSGRADLADRIRTEFGTKDPHNSSSALKARFDKALLSEVITAVSGKDGIKAQLAMAINKNVDGQLYFEKAYSRYLELKLTDPMSCALLFDGAINMGAGSVINFPAFTQGNDGGWLQIAITKLSRPERRDGWTKMLNQNFA